MRRTLAALALGAFIAAPAMAQDAAPMSDADRAQFRAEVRAYLLEHPEVIFEAIQILEERRNQASSARDSDLVAEYADQLFRAPGDHVFGNPDGDLTVVEFSDYRCGFCKRAHPAVKELLELDPDIRLVIKEFPILGPSSVAAGRIAVAAHTIEPSLYPALNDALMEHDGDLTEVMAYSIAKDVGYDIAELKEVAGSEAVEAKIRETYELARTLGLEGTPSFVIGNEIVRGYLPLDELVAVVDRVREAGGAPTAN